MELITKIDEKILDDEIAWCIIKVYFIDKTGIEYHYQVTTPVTKDQIDIAIRGVKRKFSETEWKRAKKMEIIKLKSLGETVRTKNE